MKPILFNTDMVRAIQNGTKTVTRRVVKPHSSKACGFYVTYRKSDGAFMGVYDYDEHERMFDSPQTQPAYPGDILYVRETFFEHRGHYYYRADQKHKALEKLGICFRWRPSIHMPREAARIFLRVTDVRVEKLGEITEAQAQSEGFYKGWTSTKTSSIASTAIQAFRWAWDSLIAPYRLVDYGWIANPWVWVIEFERISREEAEHGLQRAD